MKTAACALLLTLTLLVAPAGAKTTGLKHSSTKLTACDEDLQTATFQGTMNAFGKGRTLQMRFTLQARDRVTKAWTRVDAETFDVWVTASPGIARYVYDKQIKELSAGTAYRAIVRYRWRSHAGAVVARAQRTTPVCRQPDERANLKALKVKVSPGDTNASRVYTVHMVNYGDTAATPSVVSLQVNGTRVPDQTQNGLIEGDEDDVVFGGPPCVAGSQLVATVDATMLVDESDESDNTLTVDCPAGRRTGRGTT